MQMLEELPPELMLNITSSVSCRDMSSLRLVSKTMRTFCDHPMNWKSIHLDPKFENPNSLWQLADLKSIISPHVSHVQSIHIRGVRDNIIYYILSQCYNLQHLTIYGWTTLSDHCLRLRPAQSLKIKTLELIGSPQQTNYISVDAYTLGNLMIQSPNMTNLVFGCEIHIHAETFIAELEKAANSNTSEAHLQSFQLATRRTWLNEHVIRLINLYPTIQKIYLLPAAAIGFDLKNGHDIFNSLLCQTLKEVIPVTYFQRPLISTEDMILYNSNVLTI